MKTSEICPRTHRLIIDSLHEAGLPEGVLNAVSNAPGCRRDRRDDDRPSGGPPDQLHGSTRVGRIIAETAGRYLKPALLELGGKAPFVVLDDADIDQAVAAATFGAYMNQGQICMSTERIVVDETVADVDSSRRLPPRRRDARRRRPARAGNTPLGSVVDGHAARRIEQLIRDAVAKGAVLSAAAAWTVRSSRRRCSTRVTPAMRIYAEESFGPVVSVRVGSIDEAVRVANDTEYGLSAAVFGRDVNRAMQVARRIRSGSAISTARQCTTRPEVPFGGVKQSGYGRFGGRAGIAEFTELRWITVQDGPIHYPI